MLIVIVSVVVAGAAARAAWSLHRLWRVLPRSNADFGGI